MVVGSTEPFQSMTRISSSQRLAATFFMKLDKGRTKMDKNQYIKDLKLENAELRDLVSQVSESTNNVGLLRDHNVNLYQFLRASVGIINDNPSLKKKVRKTLWA